ncbi:hypothetical protein OROMI_007432 [Orobanche minor]
MDSWCQKYCKIDENCKEDMSSFVILVNLAVFLKPRVHLP